MKNENWSIFINPTIEKLFHNGPTVRATFQVIVCLSQDKTKYIIDCMGAMDMEVDVLGKTISTFDELKKINEHYKSFGVDLWDECEKDLTKEIGKYKTIEQFVFEQTGIQLKPIKHVPSYVEIMDDLKQQFGSLGYYNDKRMTFRRIKILSAKNNDIQKYMQKKYPHIETYFNNGYPWSSGLCFKLPLE
jgi:hypothetical protein